MARQGAAVKEPRLLPPMSSTRRSRAALALLAAAVPACTAADNLSSAEILAELDQIVRIEGSGAELAVRYEERARVSRWYLRSPLTQPVRWPLMVLFGRTVEDELPNPARHVRELLVELPDEVGGDLLVGALAAVRFGWIGELEQNAQSRLVAIDGLAAVAQDLGLELFRGDFDRFGAPVDPARLAAARAGVSAGRPEARGDAAWTEVEATPYATALAQLTAQPLEGSLDRLRLLEEVTALYAAERADAVRPAAGAALRAALGHVVEGLLLRVVAERTRDHVELRLCAMEQVRRLGGPGAVPLLLAVMAAPPAQIARGESRYDPEPLVQLRLIHYCGQLRPPLAHTAVTLPGRRGWVVDSPADFLAYTVLDQDDYYSKLRVPALLALTWSLQRERLDPDVGWVREWREQRR